MRILLFFIFFLFYFLNFENSAFSETLENVISHLGVKSVDELSKEIDSLPQEEKLKLELLLLIYGKENKEAEKILEKLSPCEIVSNIIVLPKNLYGIVVDKTSEILYVVKMENGFPVIVKKFHCITGKRPGDKLGEGDLRTPEGIYFPMYWRENLPPIYGLGAFPLNYPNLLDRKILKRDGHGIWIHGTNNPHRPPHSSNGCIVLKNPYLRVLKNLISTKRTPVVIVSELSFSSKEEFINEKKDLINFILKWKKAWENSPKDIDTYLSLYDERFVWKRGDINSWISYKKRITKRKNWIKIDVSDLTITKDELGNLYVARMILRYKSNNYRSTTNKVLYIYKKGKQWKILGEENL